MLEIDECVKRLFDEYRTCERHFEEAINLLDIPYAETYKKDAEDILEMIKTRPLFEKLNFVADMIFKKGELEEIPLLNPQKDETKIRELDSYIRLFWERLI